METIEVRDSTEQFSDLLKSIDQVVFYTNLLHDALANAQSAVDTILDGESDISNSGIIIAPGYNERRITVSYETWCVWRDLYSFVDANLDIPTSGLEIELVSTEEEQLTLPKSNWLYQVGFQVGSVTISCVIDGAHLDTLIN